MIVDTDKIVQNSILTLFARVSIIMASTVGLPIGGWMLLRLVSAADTISMKVDQASLKVQLLEQSVNFGFDSAKSDIGGLRVQLNDHEGRIRSIELNERTTRRP